MPKVIVVLERFGERRRQFAFGRYVRRPFHFLLNSVRELDFLGKDLQARELLVSFADYTLQILVTGSERIRLPPQRIVVGHLQRHPRIAGHEPEHRETTEKGECQYDVDRLVRNVDAPQSAAQRVREYYNEVFLLHSLSGRTLRANCVPRVPVGAICTTSCTTELAKL